MTIKVINGIPTNVGSTDDVSSFSLSANQGAAGTVIAGLNFTNSLAFQLKVHISLNASVPKNEYLTLTGTRQDTNPTTNWDLSWQRSGDNTGVTFSIDSNDDVRYYSDSYSGFVSLLFNGSAKAIE